MNHPETQQISRPGSSTTDDLSQVAAAGKVTALWRLLRGKRLAYTAAAVAVGLAALAQTGLYYILRFFVDQVLGRPELSWAIPWTAAGFVLVALIQGGLTFTSGRLAAGTAESIAKRLRDYLYDHLQRLPFSYHDRMQTGELLSRATSDVDAVRRLFSEQLIGIGRLTLLFLVHFTALLYLNVTLAVLSVLVVPVVVAISIYFFRRMEQVYEDYQNQDAVVSDRLQENLTGVRVVKAFARQEYEMARFDRENWKKYLRGVKLINLHATFWPSTDVLCGLQMIGGYYLGATMVMDGTISLGTYLAYMGLVIQIIWPIRNMGRLVAHISTGLVSLERVLEILREAREPLDDGRIRPPSRLRGEVRYEHVSFRYPTPATRPSSPARGNEAHPDGSNGLLSPEETKAGEWVLRDVTLHVAPGQVVGILGATGSGKTTLVNLLPRFYDYTEGRILLDGVELRDYPRGYLREQIGMVLQEPFLFSTTIRNNITYGVGREVSDAEVEAAARAAAIHDVILSFPKGYDTLVGERGVTLSGGQKQRITIARALLKDPSILILDDATSSVDTETDATIREALKRLMRGRTTFIIAHRVQSVMDADLIVVMDRGRIVEQGSHAELLAQGGIYRRVYDLQMRLEQELEAEIQGTQEGAYSRPRG